MSRRCCGVRALADRRGVGAVELLVALLLMAAVVHGAWRVFAQQRSAAEELRIRSEILDSGRAVRVVLGAEVAAGVPGRDWTAPAPGEVHLRAFRGWAVACPVAGTAGGLDVAYRGLRVPDPSKDSVLVLDTSGRWHPAALTGRARLSDGCDGVEGLPAAGSAPERWTLEPPVTGAVVLRVYERGSYHLTDGSLRYRRGHGGRQPMTPPVLDAATSGVRPGPGDTTLVLTLEGQDGRGGLHVRTLFGNQGWIP